MTIQTKTFTALQGLTSFVERYEYLRLNNIVGKNTFGFDRYLNQMLYSSIRWRRVRDIVIIRDNGCDLGIPGYEISGHVYVHHMNPIRVEDIERQESIIVNPEYLICTSKNTHLAIHYGNEALLPAVPIIRHSGDTCPWK